MPIIYKNNLGQWMKQNLSKITYDKLFKEMPEILGISIKTWYNYTNGYSDISLNHVQIIINNIRSEGFSVEHEDLIIPIEEESVKQ